MIFRDRRKTVVERHVYCGKCGTELKLKTVTLDKSTKDDSGVTYEYVCPQCKQICYLIQEYPRIL